MLKRKFYLQSDMDRMDQEQLTAECPDFRRAGGDCICQHCGRKYYSHPNNEPFYFLRVLCDGSVVKL